MFANKQTTYVPFTRQQLLERPLEPQVAYAIDPPGTIEVDDAVSVSFEKSRFGNDIVHLNTYIADTALLGCDNQIFKQASDRGFTSYRGRKTRFMLPKDVLSHLSLGNGGEEGAPALAVRARLREGKIALTGIDRVRVRVTPTSYNEFERLYAEGDTPEVENIVRASALIKGLGFYATENIDAHDVVASYMVLANTNLASFALHNSLPWIYRSHRGSIMTSSGKRYNPHAHYTHRHRLHRGFGGGVLYSHTTSPLRRFPDFVDQLNLAAFIEDREVPFDVDYMRDCSIDVNNKVRQMMGHYATAAA